MAASQLPNPTTPRCCDSGSVRSLRCMALGGGQFSYLLSKGHLESCRPLNAAARTLDVTVRCGLNQGVCWLVGVGDEVDEFLMHH